MIVFKAHTGGVQGLKFLADGEGLVTTGGDLVLRIWSAITGEPTKEFKTAVEVGPLGFDVSRDGRHVAFCDRPLRVLDLPALTDSAIIECGDALQLFLCPGHAVMAITGRGFTTSLWRLPSSPEDQIEQLPMPVEKPDFDTQWRVLGGFSHDGERLAYCLDQKDPEVAAKPFPAGYNCYVCEINLVDWKAARIQSKLRSKSTVRHPLPNMLKFSPDNRFIATSHTAMMRIWDLGTGEEIQFFRCSPSQIRDFRFTPDGSRLITVTFDKTVRVWDTETWTQTGAYDWQIGKLTCIDVAPDGHRYAAGGSSGKVVVWDAE